MSFNAKEIARWLGKPERLFAFHRQNKSWRYVDGDREVTVGGHVYQPAPIKRSGLNQSSEGAKNDVRLTMPRSIEIADMWRPLPPCDPVVVQVLEHHRNDSEVITRWTGYAVAPKYTDTALELTCTQFLAKHRGDAQDWMRGCGVTVYSPLCGLDRANFQFNAVLTGVNGLVLTAAAFGTSAHSLNGGWIEWTRPDGLLDRRDIAAHNGTSITLVYPPEGLAVGANVVALPGCERNFDACKARNNEANYPGFVYMPNGSQNAFEGNPI